MKSTGLLIVYHILTENTTTTRGNQPRRRAASLINFDEEHEDQTPIGDDHQAKIPPMQNDLQNVLHERPYKNEDTLVWDPHRLSEEAVKKHLMNVGVAKRRRRHQRTIYDEEVALFDLHRSNYDRKEAKRRFLNRPSVGLLDVWCEEDKHLFNVEFKKNGKDFNAIQKVIFWKSTDEIVAYYYATKNSRK